MKMNLFICRTIFQVYFSSVIIEHKKIKDVVFVYLSEGYSDRVRTILCKYTDAHYIVGGNGYTSRVLSQIKLIRALKRMLESKDVEHNIFFSSIDDPFIHTIISKFKFDGFYSFDDGTANYVDNSIFYLYKPLSIKVKLKYFLMGNRLWNIDKVKSKIQCHYSTNNLPNIIKNVEKIPLGDIERDNNSCELNKNTVNIYLCPNFDEIYKCSELVRREFLNTLCNEDIIIPHPRDKFDWSCAIKSNLKINVIAEECVRSFIASGYMVNLYGIANSTQYHYAHNKFVRNIILDLGEFNDQFNFIIRRQIELFRFICTMY